MTDAPLGTAANYDALQAILRTRADALQISREELDRVSGLPKGFCAKVLADPPLRRMGPDSIGPMLWVLGVKLAVVEDPRALAMFTAEAKTRNESYAANAMQAKSVHIKISARKMRLARIKGGKHSRKNLGKRARKQLARRAANMRWHKPKLIEVKGSDAATLRAVVDGGQPAPKLIEAKCADTAAGLIPAPSPLEQG